MYGKNIVYIIKKKTDLGQFLTLSNSKNLHFALRYEKINKAKLNFNSFSWSDIL